LAGRELAAQGEEVELAVRVASAARAVRVAQVELEALAGLAVQAAQAELAVRVASVARANRAALAELANPVALAELAVRVAPVGLANRAALELVPVVAVPVLDLVALPPKNKSAIALHRPGQVPRLVRVEDLAAAAETTRAPAVTEVVVAWAAAVTAGVAVTAE
jgi:hypothetical protein